MLIGACALRYLVKFALPFYFEGKIKQNIWKCLILGDKKKGGWIKNTKRALSVENKALSLLL